MLKLGATRWWPDLSGCQRLQCTALHWVPLTSDQLRRGTSVHAQNPELEGMQHTTVETGIIQAAP
jgi:hypothetical protein